MRPMAPAAHRAAPEYRGHRDALQVQLSADIAQLDRNIVFTPLVEIVVAGMDWSFRHKIQPRTAGCGGPDADRQSSRLQDAVLVDDRNAPFDLLASLGKYGEECERAVPGWRQDHRGGSQPDDLRALCGFRLHRQLRQRSRHQLTDALAAVVHVAWVKLTAEHLLEGSGFERNNVRARQLQLHRYGHVA